MGSARNLADLSGAFNVANGLSNQNRIINGYLGVQQYPHGSGTVTVTTASPFVVDRFRVGMSGANGTAQRIASGVNDIPYKIRMTGASGTTVAWFGQYIESANCVDLVGQSVTVTFMAASSNITSLLVNLKYMNAADSSANTTLIAAPTVAINSTLTKYKVTFANLPAQAANGLYLEFVTVGNLGTGTLDLGGIDLRKGLYSGLLPADWRQFGTEQYLCKRYFRKGVFGAIASGANGASCGLAGVFDVPMRVAPTATYVASFDVFFKGIIGTTSTGITTMGGTTTTGFFIDTLALANGVSAGQCGIVNGDANNGITFSAEI